MRHSSGLPLPAGEVQIRSYEYLSLGSVLGCGSWFDERDGNVFGALFVLLSGFGPLLLGLEQFAQMLLCLFADGLFLPADFLDVLGCPEGFSDNLREGFLVHVGLLGELHVVVGNPLVEDPSNLFEDICEVLFELWGELVEEFLNVVLDLLAVDLIEVLLDLHADATDHSLQLLHLLLQLAELLHHLLQLGVDQVFDELLLHFLQGLLPSFQLDRRVNACSLHLHPLT